MASDADPTCRTHLRSQKGGFTRRHNALKELVMDLLQETGAETRKEVHGLFRTYP